jgi:hypothetical protein
MTPEGWKEITTVNVKITDFCKDNTQFDYPVREWIEVNKKLKLKKGMRSHCSCCHTSWSLLTGKIKFVMTNKGNKVICESCFKTLIDKK